MFYDCKSLVKFVEYYSFEINKNEIKDKLNEKEK